MDFVVVVVLLLLLFFFFLSMNQREWSLPEVSVIAITSGGQKSQL